MTWTRLDDRHFDREELLDLSVGAHLLHIQALVYCNGQETDGRLRKAAIRRFVSNDHEAETRELIDAGVWHDVDDRHFQIDWTHQKLKAELQADRAKIEESRAWERTKKRHQRGDHSTCNPERCWALLERAGRPVPDRVPRGHSRDVAGDKLGTSLGSPAFPVPSRPVPTLREGRKGRKITAPPSGSALTRSPDAPPKQVVAVASLRSVHHVQSQFWSFFVSLPETTSDAETQAFWDGLDVEPQHKPSLVRERNPREVRLLVDELHHRQVERALVAALGVEPTRQVDG